jgi:hypothetical protein
MTELHELVSCRPSDPCGQCGNCAEVTTLPAPGDIPGDFLAPVVDRYRRWLGADYDFGALDAVLAAAAAERLAGDPPWLLVVGGSGAAKTETIMPLKGAGAYVASTVSGESALLSGTSRKDRAKDATGGMLREIGSHGLLVIKDVTSILSMNRDTRAMVLAALREIYDGHWSRNVGTDGGQVLAWSGRIVVIGAVTTAWDSAHQVIATMGDRFVLVRLATGADKRRAAGRQAMLNTGEEETMRAELSGAVANLLSRVDPAADVSVTDVELDDLLDVADLVTRARTAVERDWQGGPAFAHALEMPTRFAKQLVGLVRGGLAVGMDRDRAMRTALRAARDSVPPLRLRILADVAGHAMTRTAEVVKRLQLPRQTVDRTLQELHLLELLKVEDEPYGDGKVRWLYALADDVDVATVEKFTRNVSGGAEGTARREAT